MHNSTPYSIIASGSPCLIQHKKSKSKVNSSILIHRNTSDIPVGSKDTWNEGKAYFDVAFDLPRTSELQLQVSSWMDQTAEYLDHLVSKSRNDLRSHVQRVFLHIERQDGEATYGALLDLFIVLNDGGRGLRKRLLSASCDLIGKERYKLLAGHLNAGMTETSAVIPSITSWFSKGLVGTHLLVSKQNIEKNVDLDPLDEARDHIEYGQIEEARQVLEAAIIKDTQRVELHNELLDIYKRTNAKASFEAMYRKIGKDDNPTADAWRELAVEFTEAC